MTMTKIWIVHWAEWRKIPGTFWMCFSGGFPERTVFCRCGVRVVFRFIRRQWRE